MTAQVLTEMPESTAVFELDRITLGYAGRTVLRDVSLRIAAGEKVALLGESGAGKTTLLRRLREQCAQPAAWCPQQPGLVPMLSVYHNIYMGRLDRHSLWYNLANLVRPFATPRREIAALAEGLGLGDKLFTSVDRLSGGQQSRTGLARALYQQRPVFIGDEPVSALDEVQADELLGLVCARHETVILALHDVALALRHCSRIIGLRDGRIAVDSARDRTTIDQLLALYSDADPRPDSYPDPETGQ